jgi:DNA-binding transcriptional MerR regulator
MIAPERRGTARVYRERERVRLKLILRGKRLGFSLTEIRELLDLYEVARNERAQLAKVRRHARRAPGHACSSRRRTLDAVLAEIEGVERECRRRLKDEARRKAGEPAAG